MPPTSSRHGDFVTLSASHPSDDPSAEGKRRQFFAPPNLKGLFCGSGSDGMSDPYLAQAVVDLTRLSPKDISVLYLGTATYDIAKNRKRQTFQFSEMGCSVQHLDVALSAPSFEEMEEAVNTADVILVSGGNTLYAVDRWKYLGIDVNIRDAARRGAVIAGGSAGAICWFDGGHSDSMDPDTYTEQMLAKIESQSDRDEDESGSQYYDEKKSASTSVNDAKDWDYIRVDGLGIIPGLVCPHYDRIQSNGIPRSHDFDVMMKRHSTELGIGIDHNAALVIDGDSFRVLSIPGKVGSVPIIDSDVGVPGVWIKSVDEDGELHSKVCPTSGKVHEIFEEAEKILVDKRVEFCREENPFPVNLVEN